MKYFPVLSVLCAAVCGVAASVAHAAVATYRAVRAFVRGGIDAVLSKFDEPKHLPAPAVALVQACAYAMGLAKRERPRMTPGWRLCPST